MSGSRPKTIGDYYHMKHRFEFKVEGYIYIYIFGKHASFHSKKAILRLSVKQNLRLFCISLLGDIVLEYTYNYSLLKSVISSLLNHL